jgi:hypothetical protein
LRFSAFLTGVMKTIWALDEQGNAGINIVAVGI